MNDPGDFAERPQPPDDQLLARLGDVLLAAEPPPAPAMELARQAFILRRLDAELAALVEDSELDHGTAVAVRGVTVPRLRQLTFHFQDDGNDDEVVIAMEVEVRGARRRLTGHLSSRRPAEIEVRQPTAPEARPVDVDQLGRFVIDDVLPGPMSLTCRREGARPVATEWTAL